MEINLKCKDFDAWVSFLGRLGKIGSKYIIKNDIILATVKANKSGTNDKIPGRHIVRDPLFIDDEDGCIKDRIYYMINSVEYWVKIFKSIKENNMYIRKQITYIRTPDGIFVEFYGGLRYQIFKLLDKNQIEDNEEYNNYINCARCINWFDDFLKIPGSLDSEWVKFSEDELIDIRDGKVFAMHQFVLDTLMWTRIAKSTFTMAGVSRLGNPIASDAEFTFIPPSPNANEPVGMFDMHVMYKSPADSKLIKVECIHEYIILLYSEEE